MTGAEFIPWLVRAIADTLPEGTKVAEWATQEVVKRLAGGSAGAAGQALAKLLERFRSAPPAGGHEAFEALARDPSDPDAKIRLAKVLLDFLGRDDRLAEAVADEIAGFLDVGVPEAGRSARGCVPRPPRWLLGRARDLEHLRNRLAGTMTSGEPIVLTGWPGIGKTTFTAAIANDLNVAAAFPGGIFWTALDQAPNLLAKMAEWGRALGDDSILRSPTISEASKILGRLMAKRRALLIIDDAWDVEHVQPFLAAADGCQVVISTRLPEVASHLALTDDALVRLPPLAPDDAVALLRTIAGRVVDNHLPACRDLAISLECLPLSLTVAGRLIAGEARCGMNVATLVSELSTDSRAILAGRAPADWSHAAGRAPETVKVVIEKSVSRLPPDIQDCFAVLGEMIPKPSTFDLGIMKSMWQVDDPRPAARQLVDAGLIEPLGEGRFQMHAVLVDYSNAMLDD